MTQPRRLLGFRTAVFTLCVRAGDALCAFKLGVRDELRAEYTDGSDR
jgi:hypothetical protein